MALENMAAVDETMMDEGAMAEAPKDMVTMELPKEELDAAIQSLGVIMTALQAASDKAGADIASAEEPVEEAMEEGDLGAEIAAMSNTRR